VSLEGLPKGDFGTVPASLRNCGHGEVASPQHFVRELHPPMGCVGHRRHPHDFIESIGESGTRHAGLFSQRFDAPGRCGITVYGLKRPVDSAVGERGQEASLIPRKVVRLLRMPDFFTTSDGNPVPPAPIP